MLRFMLICVKLERYYDDLKSLQAIDSRILLFTL